MKIIFLFTLFFLIVSMPFHWITDGIVLFRHLELSGFVLQIRPLWLTFLE